MASKCIRIFNPGGESPQCSTHRIFLSAKPLVLCVVLTSDPVITRASAPFGPLAPPAESYRADSIQTKPHGGETVFGLPSSFTYGLNAMSIYCNGNSQLLAFLTRKMRSASCDRARAERGMRNAERENFKPEASTPQKKCGLHVQFALRVKHGAIWGRQDMAGCSPRSAV